MTPTKIADVYESQAERAEYGSRPSSQDIVGNLYDGSLLIGTAKMGQDVEFLKRHSVSAHLTIGTERLSSQVRFI